VRRQLDALVDLFARLVRKEASPGSADAEWASLRRWARWAHRFLPVCRWVPAVILLVLGIVSAIFLGSGRFGPFLAVAVVWALLGNRTVVDLVRLRLSGQSRRKVRLSAAGSVLAIVAIFAVDVWLFRST
jgi:hypothetical protein